MICADNGGLHSSQIAMPFLKESDNRTQFLFERGVPPLRRRETKGIIQDHHFAMRGLLFDSASSSVV